MVTLKTSKLCLVLTLSFFTITINVSAVIQTCQFNSDTTNYSISAWTWEVRQANDIYKLNFCGGLNNGTCKSASVCKTSAGKQLVFGKGSPSKKIYFSDRKGFTLSYDTEITCQQDASKNRTTEVVFLCGKTLGSPEFTEDSACRTVFEFHTSEACVNKPTAREIQCYVFDSQGKKRDLSPLIKTKGGHKVSGGTSLDLFINVCRNITIDDNTKHCVSSACHVVNATTSQDVGHITDSTTLQHDNGKLTLRYVTTTNVTGCPDGPPTTTITFICPSGVHNSGGSGPLLTASGRCHYEVEWETEYACPVETLTSSTCQLSNEHVKFDLEPLKKFPPYVTYGLGGDKKNYTYYINICGKIGTKCGGGSDYTRESPVAVCQELSPWGTSCGSSEKQTLRYADGQLTAIFQHGATCGSGLQRSSIISFVCDPRVGRGSPQFQYEDRCLYFFEWKTKYACSPIRPTGTSCRVASPDGVNYDLSALIKSDGKNWLAISGDEDVKSSHFYINVCGALDKTDSRITSCPNSAAACEIKSDATALSLGSYVNPPKFLHNGSVQLEYISGSDCNNHHGKKNSSITLVCNPGDLESAPVLIERSVDECFHKFIWYTAAACHLGISSGDDCKVEVKDAGFIFDLSPLSKGQGGKDGNDFYETEISDGYKFQIKICGNTDKTGCKNGTQAVSTGSCQYKDPTHHWTAGIGNSKLYYYDGMLNLTYSDGAKCRNGIARKSHVTFMCNPEAGIGKLEYEKENHCTYNFKWYTKYACPAKYVECIAEDDKGNQFDLSSLVKSQSNWVYTSGVKKYYINVCRPLKLVTGCNAFTAACVDQGFGQGGDRFINLGKVKGPPTVDSNNDDLVLVYENGDVCPTNKTKRIKTTIRFTCSTSEGSGPTLSDISSQPACEYQFTWPTSAACNVNNSIYGNNCTVKDPVTGNVFNLSPLSRNTQAYQVKDGDKTIYMNICGAAKDCSSKEDHDIAACFKDKSGAIKDLGRVSQRLQYKAQTIMLAYSSKEKTCPSLQNCEMTITFTCNRDVPRGEPVLDRMVNSMWYIDFQTSLACQPEPVECSVQDAKNQIYDLSPLSRLDGNWEAVDTRSNNDLHYLINICRQLNPSSSSLCSKGSIGACVMDHKLGGRDDYSMGLVQSRPTVSADGGLSLRYLGGSQCHKDFYRSTRINFFCSKTEGSPVFLSETPECEYVFNWNTRSACHVEPRTGSLCAVIDSRYDYKFNLLSLNKTAGGYSADLPDGSKILFNICGKLTGSPCAGDVGACLVKGGAGTLIGKFNDKLMFNGKLNLTYPGPGKYKTIISFVCAGSNDEINKPVIISRKDPIYVIEMKTPLACRPSYQVQCSLRVHANSGDKQYDFSSLARSDWNWEAKSTVPGQNVKYVINVCRTLVKLGDVANCPHGAGVCKIDYLKNDTRDAGKQRYQSLGVLSQGPVEGEGGKISLIYKDGDPCTNGKKASTHITMVCAEIEGEPILLTANDASCEYRFVWSTKAACSLNQGGAGQVFNNCTAINPVTKYTFDLNSLYNRTADYSVKDDRGYTYVMNVCGNLKHTANKGCNASTGMCQMKGENFAKSGGKLNKGLIYDAGSLYLNYSSGEKCHNGAFERNTIITFVCTPSVNGKPVMGHPIYRTESSECTYYFVWYTTLVCEEEVECIVSKEGKTISLLPLMKETENWQLEIMEDFEEAKSAQFFINVCRALNPMSGILCPAGSASCKAVATEKKYTNLGHAHGKPRIDFDGRVVLDYDHGDKCPRDTSQNLKTHITFKCLKSGLGVPKLQGLQSDGCTYEVEWLTSAVCQQEVVKGCSIKVMELGGHVFDLSVLTNTNGYEVSTSGTKYHLNVCGSVPSSLDTACKGAGVCQEKDKKFTSLGLAKFQNLQYLSEDLIKLTYCSKSCKDNPTSDMIVSIILFECNHDALLGKPILQQNTANYYEFKWATALACPPTVSPECFFKDGNQEFDLKPLSLRSRSWSVKSGNYKFWINICSTVVNGPKGCSAKTDAVCLEEQDGTVTSIGKLATQKIYKSNDDKDLMVGYNANRKTKKCPTAYTVIDFSCGSTTGGPKFISFTPSSCVYKFMWKTNAACSGVPAILIESPPCVVHHQLTNKIVDFNLLADKDLEIPEKRQDYKYKINICNDLESKCNNKKARVCQSWDNGKHSKVIGGKDRTIVYEESSFEMLLKSDVPCSHKEGKFYTAIITFSCDVTAGKGLPEFDFESNQCDYKFTWLTTLVCSNITMDGDGVKKAVSEQIMHRAHVWGIVIGILISIVIIALLVIVFHKEERREIFRIKAKWYAKKIFCCGRNFLPTYKYQKLNVNVDDEEGESLIQGESLIDMDDEDNQDDELLEL